MSADLSFKPIVLIVCSLEENTRLNLHADEIDDNLFEATLRTGFMVKVHCIDCGEVEFEAETFKEMLTLMMPHYFDAHQDIMSGQSTETQEQWMQRLTKAFEDAKNA
jgi:hypothetical protein